MRDFNRAAVGFRSLREGIGHYCHHRSAEEPQRFPQEGTAIHLTDISEEGGVTICWHDPDTLKFRRGFCMLEDVEKFLEETETRLATSGRSSFDGTNIYNVLRAECPVGTVEKDGVGDSPWTLKLKTGFQTKFASYNEARQWVGANVNHRAMP